MLRYLLTYLLTSLGAESLPDPGDFPALAVSQAEITSAIRSFPAGSGGGSDGLRPQHLVDLLTCKESGLDLASRLTDFVNLLLEGNCPDRIRRILFGGKLIALRKKDGGIRPIAVGCYWRRLASKAANNRVMQSLAEYFSPLQLGVGVSGGLRSGCARGPQIYRLYAGRLGYGEAGFVKCFQ